MAPNPSFEPALDTAMVCLDQLLPQIDQSATRGALGDNDVWFLVTRTPACTFRSVLKQLPSVAVLDVTARDSFSETLAHTMFDHLAPEYLPTHRSGRIRFIPLVFPPPSRFEVTHAH